MNMAQRSLYLLILLFAASGSTPVRDSENDNNVDDRTRRPVEEPLFKKVYITPLCSDRQNKKYLYNCKTYEEDFPINFIDIGDLTTDQPVSTTIADTTVDDELDDQATTTEFEKTEDVIE